MITLINDAALDEADGMERMMTWSMTGTSVRAGLGAAVLALLAVPAFADVKAGVDAWSEGDYANAVVKWQEPAAAGDPDAMFNLAQAYRLGRGVEIDNARARKLYEQAAMRGHVKAADNYGLMLFQEGKQEMAMPMIRAAADRGDPRAQYVLGLSHFNAEYAPRDWVRAYALMTLANGSGLPQARDALAQMDKYVPEAQRSQAQSLAREIEASARSQRIAELAAADLATRQPVTASITPPPASKQVAFLPPASAAAQVAVVQPLPVSKPAAKPPAPPAVRKSGKWRVQLGAFSVAANADRMWKQLSGKSALSGTTKALVPSGRVTRLLASGFGSQAEAARACASLKREGESCLVVGQG